MATAQRGTVLRQLHDLVAARATEEVSDADLLGRFVAVRDEAAFGALLRRHGPLVLGACRRAGGNAQDAEDAFQATFLLLARKAGSIRQRASVAGWLHGVAHRLAREARGQAARRRRHERRAADMRKTPGGADQAWQELHEALDEALGRLPPRYRAPLLLCYLEGLTQEEAALRLGCPVGTVRSRLARGRDRLKADLARQGLPLSATALAAALAAEAAPAAVPAMLLHATAKAASGYAGGADAAELVSARVVALLEQGLRALTAAKLKVTTGLLLVVGALGLGACAVATHPRSDPPPPAGRISLPGRAKGDVATKGPASPEGRQEITVRGRVLNHDGAGVGGARLSLFGKGDRFVDLGTSGGDGSFAVTIPADAQDLALVARAEGAGLDFVELGPTRPARSDRPVELRLPKDQVLRGRVVDTQVRPVSGATVEVVHVGVYAADSLEPFLTTWKKREAHYPLPPGTKRLWHAGKAVLGTTTDADGRFTLAGTGAERLVALRVRGPGVADYEAWVVNRAGFDPKPYNEATLNSLPPGSDRSGRGFHPLLHGPELSLVAEPEKPIRGTVHEADTGRGRAGVRLALFNFDGNCGYNLSATTGADGRFEFHGVRKAASYTLRIPGDPAAGLLGRHVTVADTNGYKPVTADLGRARGVIVTGRVLDAATGRAVPGTATVGVLSDNKFYRSRPEFDGALDNDLRPTGPDGTFRLVTIPGPVLITGGPTYEHRLRYKPAVADPKYPQYFPKSAELHSYFSPGGETFLQGTFCKVLRIEPGTRVVKQDVILEPAGAVPVQIRDAGGQPLRGVWALGLSPGNRSSGVESDACSVYDLEPGKSRLVVFYEPTRKLAAALTLKGTEKGLLVANLRPLGAVRGRLVGGDGKPLAGVGVAVSYVNEDLREMHDLVHVAREVTTDARGAFRIDELVPGPEFKLFRQVKKRAGERTQPVTDRALTVRSGETTDLGDLAVKTVPEGDGDGGTP